MASKIDYLLEILEKNQYRHLKGSFQSVKEETFRKSNIYHDAKTIYFELGGINTEVPWKYAVWDLEFENFAIKLDQEASFNRYRSATLKSALYSDFNFFSLENYKRYCRQFESECLKSARNSAMWTDKESERLFGNSQEPGELALKGSAKWKQRAFYEYLEDAQAALSKIKLIRISIYDNLMVNNKIIKLDSLLISRNPINEKYLLNFLLRQING
jgi:hypothetical protein